MRPKSSQWHPSKQELGFICSFLLVAMQGLAQSSGVGLWTGVQLESKLGKSFSLHVNGQVRFSDNVQITRAYLGELGIGYKLTKHWEVAGYYRYTGRLKKNDEETGYYYRPYHRFYGELSYDHKLGHGIKLDYRLRYQSQFKDDNDAVVTNKNYLRNKVELAYNNRSRYTPFISADLFYQFSQDNDPSSFDQIRTKVGTNFQFTQVHSLDLFLFTDVPLGSNNDTMTPILGVTYKIKLGSKKSKSVK